jgi:hypothetical protein
MLFLIRQSPEWIVRRGKREFTAVDSRNINRTPPEAKSTWHENITASSPDLLLLRVVVAFVPFAECPRLITQYTSPMN